MDKLINLLLIMAALCYLFVPIFKQYKVRSWNEMKHKIIKVHWYLWLLLILIVPVTYYASHALDGQEILYSEVVITLTHCLFGFGIWMFAISVLSFLSPCIFVDKTLVKCSEVK